MIYRKILSHIFITGLAWLSMIPSHSIAMEAQEQTVKLTFEEGKILEVPRKNILAIPTLAKTLLFNEKQKERSFVDMTQFNTDTQEAWERYVQPFLETLSDPTKEKLEAVFNAQQYDGDDDLNLVLIANEFYLPILVEIALQKLIQQIPNQIFDKDIFKQVVTIIEDNKSYKQIVLDYALNLVPKTLKGHTRAVRSVTFSPDSKLLASGSNDNTIKIWDAQTFKELKTLKGHTGWVNSVAFSPEGTLLASGSTDETIKIWDPNTLKALKTLKGHTDWINSVAFSPDSKFLASGSKDKTIKIWNIKIFKELETLKGHTDWISSVAFSPDGKLLASGSWDRTIKIWDAQTFKELETLKDHTRAVSSVAFSPDSKFLASGSNDKTIKIWDAQTFKELETLNGHTDGITSVAFSPDGKLLASSSYDSTIKIWDAQTFKELKTLTGTTEINSVAFSPDGKLLASGSEDETIKIWPVISFEINRETAIKQILFILYILQNKDKANWQPTPEHAATLLSLYKELSDKQKSLVPAEILQKLESIQKIDPEPMEIDQ